MGKKEVDVLRSKFCPWFVIRVHQMFFDDVSFIEEDKFLHGWLK
jgi:hypothetical protein